jgi:cobaltochelatase CobN
MHILATQIATLDEAETAIDLAQSPADVVVMSFSDSDLSALAAAWEADGALPSLRLADLKRLKHPLSVDLYIERVVAHAKVVVLRCLGGLEYWRYGLDRIAEVARARGIMLAALPGDDRPDPRLASLSTMPPEALDRLDRYFRSGGPANLRQALRYLAALLGRSATWGEPQTLGPIIRFPVETHDGSPPLPWGEGGGEGVQSFSGSIIPPHPSPLPMGEGTNPCRDATTQPVALVIFYRALLLAGDTAPISGLMEALEREGLVPIAIALSSLKDPAIAADLEALIAAHRPSVILNATAFSALRDDGSTVLDAADAPVLQIVLAGSSREAWAGSPRGLSAADQAMHVVLPELDGRLLTRAISFKAESAADPALEYSCVRHQPDSGRIAHVARLAAAWARLGEMPRCERRLAMILSDYPAREGRAGYAVGLDTAESAARIAALLAREGFDVGDGMEAADVEALLNGAAGEELAIPLAVYGQWLASLPPQLQDEIGGAWGDAADDPALHRDAFRFRIARAGKLVIALQPDRGAKADRKSGYHDAAIPPRHAYVAFYRWLRETEQIDALVHLGTHGTLEWLPGKALALSEACWPEAMLGPVPVIYPFIVNNPGEAVAAKRRIGAVTIGHLTPPLRRAGLHGRLAVLENLVEEYAGADGLDRRRVAALEQAIMNAAHASGFAAECGLAPADTGRDAIARLDARLCDIKELSIRDSFHVFARAPSEADQSLLVETMAEAAPAGLTEPERGSARQALAVSARREGDALICALDGRRVAPGPAGAPTRGRFDVLPTGRNLTAIDPRAIPTRTAATIGKLAAEEVIRRYLQDHGDYPRALVMTLWASASLRTGGDDLAQALHYLGAVPVWDAMSNRVTGVEILPLAKLGRPRVDVTLRISGLFRDLFETQIALFDLAVRQVAARDEEAADNPLAEVRRRGGDLARIFGGAPGSYGAGVASAALDAPWTSRAELGRAALANVTHRYGGGAQDGAPHAGFGARIAASSALIQPQDNAEQDVLDSDEIADFAGGMAAAAALLGVSPALYHLDTSSPMAPKARTMAESVARVVRGRLINPRWLAGMLGHGHRGVAEIAQGVDALYAFAATADVVPPHLFEAVHDALIADETVLSAMKVRNPAAAASIARRLQDALGRGMWTARRNAVAEELIAALEHDRQKRAPVWRESADMVLASGRPFKGAAE